MNLQFLFWNVIVMVVLADVVVAIALYRWARTIKKLLDAVKEEKV